MPYLLTLDERLSLLSSPQIYSLSNNIVIVIVILTLGESSRPPPTYETQIKKGSPMDSPHVCRCGANIILNCVIDLLT